MRSKSDEAIARGIENQRAVERFWSRVHVTDGCWTWGAYRNTKGYGVVCISANGYRAYALAHRFSWAIANSDVPSDGMFICHHCDNPPCVNPAHLFLGTNDDNVLDCVKKGRIAIGEKNSRAILNESDVRDIRHMAKTMSGVSIAAHYGVSTGAVYNIIHRVRWKHVK